MYLLIKLNWTKFPCVLKAGHCHGGVATAKIDNIGALQDAVGLLNGTGLTENGAYCSLEPFIDSKFDVHIQKIGGNYKAFMRKSISGSWKTNQGQAMLEQIQMTEKYKSWIDEEIAQKKKQQRGGSISSLSSIFGSKDLPESPKPVATTGPPSHPPPPAPTSTTATSNDTSASATSRGTPVSSFETTKTSITTQQHGSTTSSSTFPTRDQPQWYSPKKSVPDPTVTSTLSDIKSTTSTPKTSSLSSQDSRTGSITSTVSPVVNGYSSMSSLDKSTNSITTKEEPRMPFSTISTQSSTYDMPRNQVVIPTPSTYRSQSSTEQSYTPPPSAIEKVKDFHKPLSRKDSSDSELIFGGKDAESFRSKYAYSTYTSTNKSSDMDVIFSSSIDKRSSMDSNTSNNSYSGSRDSTDFNTSYRNPSSYRGIQNPMFQDYDTGASVEKKSTSRSHDDDDEFDLK
uniref:CSON012491 protein n=1 Tax=Culicoides sonorensis TaxID=179676 RepID=A0A336M5N4_CULSO